MYNLVTPLLQAWHLPIALQAMRGYTLMMVPMLPTLLILLPMLLYLVMLPYIARSCPPPTLEVVGGYGGGVGGSVGEG